MFRNILVLLVLLPLLLSAQINTGGGSYQDASGNTQIYKPWPDQSPPTPPNQLPGAMWIVSFAINDLAATVGRAFVDLQNHEQAINEFDSRFKGLEASLSAISANAQRTGSGGGIVQSKDWPLSAVLAKGAVDTDHGITVKTLDTTGNITSSSGSVIADIITGREGITTPGWIQASGNITAGTLTSGGGIAAGGKITGVSEPTAGTDAATKHYVDTTFAPASSNSVVVYTITSVTATGFTLSPVRLMGVTSGDASGSPSFEFSEEDVVSAVTSDSAKLSQSRRKALIHVTSPAVSTEIIQYVDHGSFGN